VSNRTWTCVPCRKSFRRDQSVAAVACPHCHQPCEYVHWKMRVPSPRRVKEWEAFWAAYRAEKALLAAHHRGELRELVELPLLNMVLHPPG
jgi:DNA-directed RNA polymerase subunit RPC12/RpoP